MAERTPAVKKYRDALENVISATMEFLARPIPPMNPNQDPALTSPSQTNVQVSSAQTPAASSRVVFTPGLTGLGEDIYIRDNMKTEGPRGIGERSNANFTELEGDVFGYLPQSQMSPQTEELWDGRASGIGHMDADWMLSLCEGDGFSLQMLNDMMRFDPSMGT